MLKIIFISFVTLFLMGNTCTDTDHTVSGSVTLDVPQLVVTFAQENGINYIRVTQADFIVECIALEPGALYSATFESLTFQDQFRVSNYSAEELAKCS